MRKKEAGDRTVCFYGKYIRWKRIIIIIIIIIPQ